MAAIELEGLTTDYGEVVANDGGTIDIELGRRRSLRHPLPFALLTVG